MMLSCKNNVVLLSSDAQREITLFCDTGETISDDCAKTIAVWYMSPGVIGHYLSNLVHAEVDHHDLQMDMKRSQMDEDDWLALDDWVWSKVKFRDR